MPLQRRNPRSRPIGVTIIALSLLTSGSSALLIFASLLFHLIDMRMFPAKALSEGGPDVFITLARLGTVLTWLSLIGTILSCLLLACGVGLLKIKRWGLHLTYSILGTLISFLSLIIVVDLLSLQSGRKSTQFLGEDFMRLGIEITVTGIVIAFLWYLKRIDSQLWRQ
jgi:amino acid transporter